MRILPIYLLFAYSKVVASCPQDNANAKFFLQMNKVGNAVVKNCEWLSKRSEEGIQKNCAKTESYGGYLPAKEVCVKTCGLCDAPSGRPSVSASPSEASDVPSMEPSTFPSSMPSYLPSDALSEKPSILPSDVPSMEPSLYPSTVPSILPSKIFSGKPSATPSNTPSIEPSTYPSSSPSSLPSLSPSEEPSSVPSIQPSMKPSRIPSSVPSNLPSLSPSEMPSQTPTISSLPTVCYENPDALFDIIIRKGPNKGRKKRKCRWLRLKEGRIENYCSKEKSRQARRPAKEVCLNTCGTCDRMDPSQSPSMIPSSIPSSDPTNVLSSVPSSSPSDEPSNVPSKQLSMLPSSVPSSPPSSSQRPTTCYENPNQAFYIIKVPPNNTPQRRKCKWLQQQNQKNIDDYCDRTESGLGRPPPNEVCLNTCGTCDRMDPSQSPSMMPSSIPSFSPSDVPSLVPSMSPSIEPSSQPSLSNMPSNKPSECAENADAEFFLQMNKNNKPVNKSCSWLKGRASFRIEDICQRNISNGGFEPANRVCRNTCETCNLRLPDNDIVLVTTYREYIDALSLLYLANTTFVE